MRSVTIVQTCLLSVVLMSFCSQAYAVGQGFYLGAGGGFTRFEPKPVDSDITVAQKKQASQMLIIGYDESSLMGVELILNQLGEARFSEQSEVIYQSVDIAGVYRLYDRREQVHDSWFDYNIFTKVGVGFLSLDRDLVLESESRVHMLAGIGAELSLFGGLYLRAEYDFIDAKFNQANLSLIKRFTKRAKNLPQSSISSSVYAKKQPIDDVTMPSPVPVEDTLIAEHDIPAPNAPEPKIPETKVPETKVPETKVPEPEVVQPVEPRQDIPVETLPLLTDVAPENKVSIDNDQDGVWNENDECDDTPSGYPVRDNGCPLLQGEIRNIQFAVNDVALNANTRSTLLGLAQLFIQYPNVMVKFHAHTKRIGTIEQQVELSRRRLVAIAAFLADQGVFMPNIRFVTYGGKKADARGAYTDRIEITEQR